MRAWPTVVPAKPHVTDSAARVAVDRYDYRGLADVGDDVISLDWDVAVSREDVVAFAERAKSRPGHALVAPYPIYADSRRGLPATVWALKRYEGQWTRYVETGEPSCHLFGFGMVYLPRHAVCGFVEHYRDRLAAGQMVMDDITFSTWHHREVEEETLIDWQTRPVHLHYDISAVPL